MSGTLGPSIYLPDPSNTQASPGQGWAAGISAIGNALFPNPAALADARLRGAQAQQVQQQTQQAATAIGARSAIAHFYANPTAAATPEGRSYLLSQIPLLDPAEQQQARSNFGLAVTNSGMSPSDVDRFNASAGLTNYTQTPTGVNEELQNRIRTAQIAAGPGYAQAAATLTAERERTAEQRREYDVTPTATVINGAIVNVPRVPISGAQPAWAGQPDANATLEQQRIAEQGRQYNLTPTPTVLNGTIVNVPRGNLPAWAGQPAATATDEARAAAAVGATPLAPASHGVSPSAAATQPQSGAGVVALPANESGNPSPVAGALSPDTDQLNQRLMYLSGAPVTRQTPRDAIAMDTMLNNKIKNDLGTSLPLGFGQSFTLGPNLKAALTSRINELMQGADRRFNNPQAAVDQAYQEIVEPNRQNLVYDARRFTGLEPTVDLPANFTAKRPAPIPTPTTPLAPSAQAAPAPATTPPPMAPSGRQNIAPPTLHPSAQPGGGGTFQTTPGGSIAQSRPVVPGVPLPGPHQGESQTPAPPVGPAPMPANQLVPHKSKVNGYVYTGGNPRSPTSWMKAPGG